MNDQPEKADETPIQRALRLKKAALKAKPNAAETGVRREQARMPSGASKPWMKK